MIDPSAAVCSSAHISVPARPTFEDLKSYGEIAAAHAEAIKRLIPVFTVLYEGMSDTQKLAADRLFRHGDRMFGQRKHGRKAPAGQ